MTAAERPLVPVDTVHAFATPPSLLVRGADTGPLADLRLAVKGVIDVAGVVTTAGTPAFGRGRRRAVRSAPCVDALVAAGASVVGITVTDEMAYSLAGDNVHHPRVRNAAAPGRTTGGSSSGSAAAVAGGLVELALATDTGGSIRVPASYCGVFGWRPTQGAVSVEGVVPLAPSFDAVGLLAPDAARLQAGAEVVLAGAGGPMAGLAGPGSGRRPELAFVGEVMDVVPPDVADAARGAGRSLAGAVPPELALGVDLVAAREAFRVVQGHEAWAAHGAWIEAAQPDFGAVIERRFRAASAITADEVAAAASVWRTVRAAVLEATAGHVLLVPASAGAAPVPGEPGAVAEARRAATMSITCLAGLAGAPVVVVPGARVEGLPIGIAAIGAPGRDRELLAWAASIASGSGADVRIGGA